MADLFQTALARVLAHEGGFSMHPNDPGGATKYGITIGVLGEWRGRVASVDDVKALTKSEAAEIYRARYWNACRCDDLPAGVSYAVFDCAVNQGVGRAARFLQQSCGVAVDGFIGPVTIAAARAADPGLLLSEFSARRMHAYGNLASLFRTFGLGWSRRLLTAHSFALADLSRGKPLATDAAPALPSPAAETPKETPAMSTQPQTPAPIPAPMPGLDGLLGGGLMLGRKTIVGIVGYLLVYFADKFGIAPTFFTPEMVEIMTNLLLALAGLGAAAKVSRVEKKLDEVKAVDPAFDPFGIR